MTIAGLPVVIVCVAAAALSVQVEGRDAFHWSGKLKRGINISAALEAPEEGRWGVVIQEEHFDVIKAAGFDSVRLPVRWNTHAGDEAPYTVDPAFLRRVDQVLRWGLDRGLVMVLDWHHYREFIDEDPDGHSARFFAMWEQLAAHYSDWPPTLYFEILNEPAKKMTAELWNEYQVEALRIIRKTNPDRAVVVGPVAYSNVNELEHLRLPESDRNLIVTFHVYEPHRFTHQGKHGLPTNVRWGYPAQRERISDLIERAAGFGRQTDRPVWLGEFGTRMVIDIAQRQKWTAFVRGEAEKHGIPWAYWGFCSKEFGAYDQNARQWNEDLLEALFSPDPAAVVEKAHAPDRIDGQAVERHIRSNFAELGGGTDWRGPGKKGDLSDVAAASARVELTVDADTRGVIMEAGAEARGLALYIDNGVLYFQCGNGSAFGAPMQAVCRTEITPGRHVVLWSADADKGMVVLCVDGTKVSEFSGSFGPKLAGPDTGRLGGVQNGIARNAGNFTNENGTFTGLIHSCTVWPHRSIF
jgi:endoglucanase